MIFFLISGVLQVNFISYIKNIKPHFFKIRGILLKIMHHMLVNPGNYSFYMDFIITSFTATLCDLN